MPILRGFILAAIFLDILQAQGLQDELDARKKAFAERAPAELLESQDQALSELEASGVYDRVLKVGDKAPDFTLKNHEGKDVNLSDLLEKGPVVLTWYRGGWCPYCNITLAALAKKNAEIEELGATLVAMTPELPDSTAASVEEQGLNFEVLTDEGHAIAEKFGLVFPLNEDTKKRYEEKFGLEKRSGKSAEGRLPLPATYVVSKGGTITYVFADADYRRRAEPARVIDALKAIKDGASDRHMVLQYWENVWNPPYDLDLIDKLMDERFTRTSAGKDTIGRGKFKEWVSNFQKNVSGLRLEKLSCFPAEEGTSTVCRWKVIGINRGALEDEADGSLLQFSGVSLWQIYEGKLVRNWTERSAWELYKHLEE